MHELEQDEIRGATGARRGMSGHTKRRRTADAARPSTVTSGFQLAAFFRRCDVRRCDVATLAHLDAESKALSRSRMDAEPAGLDLMQREEPKADNGENDDACKHSQHNGTLQPPHHAMR